MPRMKYVKLDFEDERATQLATKINNLENRYYLLEHRGVNSLKLMYTNYIPDLIFKFL